MIAASPVAPPPAALWLAAALLLAGLLLPDCCLTGRHAHGLAMASFGPICRALR
jgi:hypothetical protein